MASYSSSLKTWGAAGAIYPDGYSYVEGEQPVDDWDNFFNSNVYDDITHLVGITNARLADEDGTEASAGGLRLQNAEWMAARNNANGGDVNMWQVNSGDEIRAGADVRLNSDLKAVHGEVIWDESASELNASVIPSSIARDTELTDVSEDGTTLVSQISDLNFSGDLTVTDDGDGTVTVDFSETADYTDEEAQDAVAAMLTGGNALTGTYNDADNTYTFDHDDTSTQGSVTGGAGVVIEDVSLDTYGHVTSLGTVDLDSRYDNYSSWTLVEGNGSESNTVVSGESVTIYGGTDIYTEMDDSDNLQINHSDTSTQGNVNTSSDTIIDNISLDGRGHVTSIGTAGFTHDGLTSVSHGQHSATKTIRNFEQQDNTPIDPAWSETRTQTGGTSSFDTSTPIDGSVSRNLDAGGGGHEGHELTRATPCHPTIITGKVRQDTHGGNFGNQARVQLGDKDLTTEYIFRVSLDSNSIDVNGSDVSGGAGSVENDVYRVELTNIDWYNQTYDWALYNESNGDSVVGSGSGTAFENPATKFDWIHYVQTSVSGSSANSTYDSFVADGGPY